MVVFIEHFIFELCYTFQGLQSTQRMKISIWSATLSAGKLWKKKIVIVPSIIWLIQAVFIAFSLHTNASILPKYGEKKMRTATVVYDRHTFLICYSTRHGQRCVKSRRDALPMIDIKLARHRIFLDATFTAKITSIQFDVAMRNCQVAWYIYTSIGNINAGRNPHVPCDLQQT